MKRIFVFCLAFVFTLSMVSLTLSKVPTWRGTIVATWVDDARAKVKTVTDADVKAVIDKQVVGPIILDVRDPDEFMKGHLPGAINVSRGKLEFVIWDRIPDRDAKIYVYCLRGPRATFATKTLNDMGYKNALLMTTHFEPWEKAGFPVTK